MTVRRTIEDLPPIYAIRCAETRIYLGGWLTAERRDAAIVERGWRMVE